MNKITVGVDNNEMKIIRDLKLRRTKRAETGEIFIEGTNCVRQAAGAGLEFTRLITARGRCLSGWARSLIEKTEKKAPPGETLLVEMDPELYASLTGRSDPPEILATARIKPPEPEELRLSPRPFVLAFDRPGDAGNLGSIIRSANAFGADAILVLGPGADPWESKSIRASLGSVFHTQVAALRSAGALAAFIRGEKAKNGLLVLGTDSTGSAPLPGRSFQRPILLIIPSETKGLSPDLKPLCDEVVRIPLAGTAPSLNAACAASIVMWEVYRGARP